MIDLRAASGLGAAFDELMGRLPPEMPRSFANMLAAAIAVEERDGGPRAGNLRMLYLETMPMLRRQQLDRSAQPAASFFHSPLDWQRMPRLSAAIDRWLALLAEAGLTRDDPRRHRTLAELYDQTYYGGFMPLLYAYPNDLGYFARGLSDGAPAAIDRFLTAPVLHELAHGARERQAIFPMHLDESVAGYLGVHTLPAFAYPEAGSDDAIYAAPWFAQVGQALVRAFGLQPIVRAHLGAARWDQVLSPELVAALGRIGWDDWLRTRYPHFLSDNVQPERWMKLFFLGAAKRSLEALDIAALDALSWRDVPAPAEDPFDARIIADALRCMCLHNDKIDQHFVVRLAAPRGPLSIDLDDCVVRAPAGPIDAAPPRYWFPPSVAARLRALGHHGITVELSDPAAIEEVVALILDGKCGTLKQSWRASFY